jgi:hypothetical protein
MSNEISSLRSAFKLLRNTPEKTDMTRTRVFASAILMSALQVQGHAQTAQPENRTRQPLYQVTIVSRTTKAINYGYLSAPTRIGFQGTAVLPKSTGEATVEPKRGSTVLKMSFDRLPPPSQFGAQYLTYVVWAISPDGRAQNLGELILDGDDDGKLTTSTPLQTFALIVTAEPYYSVSQPSDVVVLENVVRSDTVGKVQEVNATYELLPRKPFTYDMTPKPEASRKMVSSKEYEAMAALYQALNAIQIAQSQDADRYARDQMSRARQIYDQARGFPLHLSKEIVSLAREATQIAEDSRAIAVRRAAAEAAASDQQRSRPAPEPAAAAQPSNQK